uniref:peroxiredoxin n=1 Tax=Duodenibacillus massiliensis TaxID=1852381 RepID=UPI003077C728
MTDGRDLKAGDKAPDFELMTDAGESVRLSELRGHKVILYFYPEDNTPGCTAQAQDFRDTIKEFKALGYSIYGVSNDNQASHCDFRDRYKLTFPLLCDTDRTVSNSSSGPRWQCGEWCPATP